MTEINPYSLNENAFDLIGKKWGLVGAKTEDGKYNCMTVSWGGMGILWNKPVCFLFIRPQRYTFEFTEKTNFISLSFFDEKYRKDLSYLGTVSGRDGDKIAKTDLVPVIKDEYLTFDNANLTFLCKKIYYNDLLPENFLSADIIKNYDQNDFHRMYICEIEKIYKKM